MLAEIGEKAANHAVINNLTKILADSDSGVRRGACEALLKLGWNAASDVAINGLIKALDHSDFDVRRTACKALGKLGRKQQVMSPSMV